MRLMVYSHDGFGLGNIRRMLAICEHLLNDLPQLSILLVSGSPMVQGFRLPRGLDYIKLPCLNRGEEGNLVAKYLGTATEETIQLRSDLILSVTANFKPDLLLVDKKPYGIRHELSATLNHCKTSLPETQLVLLLRDILDSPETTIADWQINNYYDAIQRFYSSVLVVGIREVFDVCKEYQFPSEIARKVHYCGYIRRPLGCKSVSRVRRELRLSPGQRLVLVTPGGGEDGYPLVEAYLAGLALLPTSHNFRSLIICGPEMPQQQKQSLTQMAKQFPQVQLGEFTDDLISYMAAADAVAAMGGYNTICEILSAGKRAVVVPRNKPSEEQLIRAARMSRLGLFKAIHPQQLTPKVLMRSVLQQLSHDRLSPGLHLDMDALPRISQHLSRLLQVKRRDNISYLTQKLASASPVAVGN
jgi:predicted glycosyltransferase